MYRISINARNIEGAFGGANQFANNLENYLQNKGYNVFRKLVPRLDIVLIVSSQKQSQIAAYNIDNISDYISLNPNTIVVHRVNSCDEQRGINLGINDAILNANQIADYTIFVSSFVKDLFSAQGINLKKPNCIILNGADEEIFHPNGRAIFVPNQKLKIVTHHWSSNFMKGFDIYERLDELLAIKPFQDLFEFTYIGNVPKGVKFINTRIIPPASGNALGSLLRENHVYLTAARHEPGGNHYVEGMRSGLPILFLRTGSLPEYCAAFGIEFTLANFNEKLLEMYQQYEELREIVVQCPHASTAMGEQYEKVFLHLLSERKTSPHANPGIAKKLKYYLLDRPVSKYFKFRDLLLKILNYLKST